jgi:hypothetical protein
MLPSQGNKAPYVSTKIIFWTISCLDSVKDKRIRFFKKTKPVVLVSTLIAKPFYCRVTLKNHSNLKLQKSLICSIYTISFSIILIVLLLL